MKILYGFIVIDVDDQRFERKTYHSKRIGIHFRNHEPIASELPFAPVCL